MPMQPPMQRVKTAQHARSASAAPLTSPTSTTASAPASLSLRTPLGAARTLRPSHSNGQLAREFQDKHSSTYAHLYISGTDKENAGGDAIQAKLELEELAMQAERKAARERREVYLRSIGTVSAANQGVEEHDKGEEHGKRKEKENTGEGKRGAWRPLSLVAKRQAALGHARSASASTAVVAAASSARPVLTGIRSVSHTPTSSLTTSLLPARDRVGPVAPSAASANSNTRTRRPISMSLPPSLHPNLEVVIEGEAYADNDEHVEEMQSEISTRDSAMSNRYRPLSFPASETSRAGSRIGNTSTYSWATSFSGETAELRAAAHYVGSDDHGRGSMDSTPSRASVRASVSGSPLTDSATSGQQEDGTPPKIKQRRKRIVTLAHTVRQLEGVGSREPEDPDFYEKLVKAWNERPGVVPVPVPNQPKSILQSGNAHAGPSGTREDAMRALTEAPPTFGAVRGYEATPAMTEPSPALEVRSPSDRDEVYTPYVGQACIASTSYGYEYGFEQPRMYTTDRTSRATGSIRYSYASTLHDLALEGGYVQGDRLMADKPWLRGDDTGYTDSQFAQGVTSRFGIGLGDAFDMPPPAFAGPPPGLHAPGAFSPIDPGTPCRLNDEDPMESANSLRPTCPPTGASGTSTNRISFDKLQAGIATSDWLRPSKSRANGWNTAASTTTSTPTRPLRRVEGQVLRYGQPFALPDDEKPAASVDRALSGRLALPIGAGDSYGEGVPAEQGNGSQGQAWGLGFMSTWWNDRQSNIPALAGQTSSDDVDVKRGRADVDEQDFHMGKDGNRSSRRTEMDWKNWTKGSSACGDGEMSVAIRGDRSSGDIFPREARVETPSGAMNARSESQTLQSQPRVLLQGRKRPRVSSWSHSSGSRAPSAAAPVQAPSFPHFHQNDPVAVAAAPAWQAEGSGQMEWLGTSDVHVSTSRAQTPNSFMTRHSRASRFSRGSRLSGAQTATTSSPMYSYPVSTDSSFSATYPRVLRSGVRAHQRAFSTGSIVHRGEMGHAMQPDQDQMDQVPSMPLHPIAYPSRIDFTRTPSDLETRQAFVLGAEAQDRQAEETLRPSTSAATTPIAPATTSTSTSANTIGEGEREFPFSSLCRRPSSSTHSHTSFPPPLFAHHPLPLPMPLSGDEVSGQSLTGQPQTFDNQPQRPVPSRNHSRQAYEQEQARRAAELGLGRPPISGTIRWTPSVEEDLSSSGQMQTQAHTLPATDTAQAQEWSAAGPPAYPAGAANANDAQGQKAKALRHVQSETPMPEVRTDGLRGWASSLFPSRPTRPMPADREAVQVQGVPEIASSVPMRRESTDMMYVQHHHQHQQYPPAIRPRLSSRPQLSTLRQRPSLTIRLPDVDARAGGQVLSGHLPALGVTPEQGQTRVKANKSVKRKSVSPMRVLEADADMRVPVKVSTATHLTPAAALTLSRSNSEALSNTLSQSHSSGPPTATHSAFSHETLLLPPPATPATPATPGTPGTPVTPGTPAESSYSMFMGVPLSPLPTPPLPPMSMSAAMDKGKGRDMDDQVGLPSVWMTSKSSIPPRPLSSTLYTHTRQPMVMPLPVSIDGDTASAEVEGQERRDGPLVHRPLHPHPMDTHQQEEGGWYPTPRLPLHSALTDTQSNPIHINMPRPNYADSSCPTESIGEDDTRYSPVRAEGAGMYGGAFRPDGTIRHDPTLDSERQVGAATAMGIAATAPPRPAHPPTANSRSTRRSALPATFFWLGIFMPWFWLIAGWGLKPSLAPAEEDMEQGVEKQYGPGVASTAIHADATAHGKRARGWLYHSDPWCRRSRIAAATVLPGVAVGAVAAVVVLAVLR